MLILVGTRQETVAGLWSNPLTWGPPGEGEVPAGGDVVIPEGKTVYADVNTAPLGHLSVEGQLLNYGNANVQITAASVDAPGVFQIGTAAAPYAGQFVLELNGAEAGKADRYVADQTGSSGAGNGKLVQLFVSSGAVAETITITWSSAIAFSVSGSVSGSLGSGAVGTWFINKIRFLATAGGTAWASGHTRTVTVVKRGFTNSGLPRSLQSNAGTIRLRGVPPTVVRTRLGDHLNIDDQVVVLAEPVTWKAGDVFVVGPSDFNGDSGGVASPTTSGISEVFTVAFDVNNSTSVPVTEPATRFKWGKLQYPTNIGISLTQGTLTKPAAWTQDDWDHVPKVYDVRAMVIHLTRNIKVRGANDSAWATSGFGAHMMFMDLAGRIDIDGVEWLRVGQAGTIARYPIHAHVLSYNMPNGMTLPSDGTFLGATTNENHRVTNCSIWQSSNRAVTIHMTHGMLVQRNVAYDITGHAYFLEDGAEEDYTLDQNVAFTGVVPTSANKLLDHDIEDAFAGTAGTAGFWLTNPNGTVTDNWACGFKLGFWNAFAATRCFGLAGEVAIVPTNRPVKEHRGNIGFCNAYRGMMTEGPPTDNKGSITAAFFNGQPVDGVRYRFTGNQAMKNGLGAYHNRGATDGFYDSWVVGDNGRLDFSGQVDYDVYLRWPLMVAVSLNNANNAEARAVNSRRCGWVTYDEGFVPKHVLALHYTNREPPSFSRDDYSGQSSNIQGGGFLRMGEYIQPIWTCTYSADWMLVDCSPGFMCPPPHIDGHGGLAGNQKFTLGVLKDVNGLFTGVANRFVVWNDPFYTFGASNLGDWSNSWGKVTDTQHFAIMHGLVKGIDEDANINQALFYVDRYDPADLTTIVGSWNIPDSRSGGFGLSHFKHFAAARGGVYKIHWNGELPNGTNPYVELGVEFLHSTADIATLIVAWPNAVPVGTVYLRYGRAGTNISILTAAELTNTAGSPPLPYAIKFNNTGMTSKANVHADTSGLKFWQDTTNNELVIKLKGGLVYDEQRLRGSGLLDPNRQMGLVITSLSLP